VLVLRGGILEGEQLSAAEVEQLATLPRWTFLQSQLVGAIVAPLNALLGLVSAPLRDLHGLVSARIEQLEAEGQVVAEAAPAEAPSEPAEAVADAEQPIAEAAADEVAEVEDTETRRSPRPRSPPIKRRGG